MAAVQARQHKEQVDLSNLLFVNLTLKSFSQSLPLKVTQLQIFKYLFYSCFLS